MTIQLMRYALLQLFAEYWDTFFSLIAIWLLYRRLRYATAALARVPQEKLLLQNAIWKTAFETVLREQPRRLRDLVEDTESESSHKP